MGEYKKIVLEENLRLEIEDILNEGFWDLFPSSNPEMLSKVDNIIKKLQDRLVRIGNSLDKVASVSAEYGSGTLAGETEEAFKDINNERKKTEKELEKYKKLRSKFA